MKGAFESFLVLLFGMTFFLLAISLFTVNFQFQKARMFQESILQLIERHDRYDKYVEALINLKHCPKCRYSVRTQKTNYQVRVTFPVEIPILKFKKELELTASTFTIKQPS